MANTEVKLVGFPDGVLPERLLGRIESFMQELSAELTAEESQAITQFTRQQAMPVEYVLSVEIPVGQNKLTVKCAAHSVEQVAMISHRLSEALGREVE